MCEVIVFVLGFSVQNVGRKGYIVNILVMADLESYKVCILGPGAVGKSSLTVQYVCALDTL